MSRSPGLVPNGASLGRGDPEAPFLPPPKGLSLRRGWLALNI